MAVIKDNKPIYKMYYGETPIYNILTQEIKDNIFIERLGWSEEDEDELLLIIEYAEQKAKEFNPNNTSQSQFFWEGAMEQHPLIFPPMLDFSKVENCYELFSMCTSLITVPKYDFGKVKNARGMFNRCEKLVTIPELNFENVEDACEMFFYAYNLKKLPPLNFSKVTIINGFFGYWDDIKYLTDCGGFIGLSIDWTDDEGLCRCPNLSAESVENIINGLADMTGGEGKTLKLHQDVVNRTSTELLTRALNKNWSIIA